MLHFSSTMRHSCFRYEGVYSDSTFYNSRYKHKGKRKKDIARVYERNSAQHTYRRNTLLSPLWQLPSWLGHCTIHRLSLCRRVRPPPHTHTHTHTPTCVLDMTLNNLMLRFQWCWSFGKCGAPLNGPEW